MFVGECWCCGSSKQLWNFVGQGQMSRCFSYILPTTVRSRPPVSHQRLSRFTHRTIRFYFFVLFLLHFHFLLLLLVLRWIAWRLWSSDGLGVSSSRFSLAFSLLLFLLEIIFQCFCCCWGETKTEFISRALMVDVVLMSRSVNSDAIKLGGDWDCAVPIKGDDHGASEQRTTYGLMINRVAIYLYRRE